MAHRTISSGPSDRLHLPWSWCALTARLPDRDLSPDPVYCGDSADGAPLAGHASNVLHSAPMGQECAALKDELVRRLAHDP
jgi:hypothetical protein